MQFELESASNFIIALIELGKIKIGKERKRKFREEIINVMKRRYRDHWFPEKPDKGSGYRCIRINNRLDPVLVQACHNCGIDPSTVRSALPTLLTLWVNPFSVSYKIGEHGSVFDLYEFKENGLDRPWTHFKKKEEKEKGEGKTGGDLKSLHGFVRRLLSYSVE
jgi:protein Tob/BTG